MSTSLSTTRNEDLMYDLNYDQYNIVSTGCLRGKCIGMTTTQIFRETQFVSYCKGFGVSVYESVYTFLRLNTFFLDNFIIQNQVRQGTIQQVRSYKVFHDYFKQPSIIHSQRILNYTRVTSLNTYSQNNFFEKILSLMLQVASIFCREELNQFFLQ